MCGIGVARRRTSLHQNILSLEYVLESGLFLECAEGANPLPPRRHQFLFGFGLISGLTLIAPRGDANADRHSPRASDSAYTRSVLCRTTSIYIVSQKNKTPNSCLYLCQKLYICMSSVTLVHPAKSRWTE